MVQAFDDTRPRRPLSPVGPSAGRVPPHNLEAEESLLGAMLLSRDAIATDVIAMLQDLADKGFLTQAREKTS